MRFCSGNTLSQTLISSELSYISRNVYVPVTTLCFLPLRGSGVRALRRDSRATKPNPETGVVEPRFERRSGKSWNVCGREGNSDEIGGTGRKKGESERGVEEVHARRGKRMNLGRGKVGNGVERTGRKEGEGN